MLKWEWAAGGVGDVPAVQLDLLRAACGCGNEGLGKGLCSGSLVSGPGR